MIVYKGSSKTRKTSNTCGFKTGTASGGWGQELPGKVHQGTSGLMVMFSILTDVVLNKYMYLSAHHMILKVCISYEILHRKIKEQHRPLVNNEHAEVLGLK